jgi:hypothetical protein
MDDSLLILGATEILLTGSCFVSFSFLPLSRKFVLILTDK